MVRVTNIDFTSTFRTETFADHDEVVQGTLNGNPAFSLGTFKCMGHVP